MDIRELLPNQEKWYKLEKSYQEKCQRALDMLLEANDGKSIYGGEYNEVKFRLTRLYDRWKGSFISEVAHKQMNAVRKSMPNLDSPEQAVSQAAYQEYYKRAETLEAIYYDNGGIANIASLKKKLAKVSSEFRNSDYDDFVAFADAWEPIGKILKEVKQKVIKGKRPKEKSDVQKQQELISELNKKTCPCCIGRFATHKDGTMVLHGYKRPGVGFAVGECIGYEKHFLPLEESLDGSYYMYLRGRKQEKEAVLLKLKLENGEVESIQYNDIERKAGHSHKVVKTATPASPEWQSVLQKSIAEQKHIIREAQDSQLFYYGVLRDHFNTTYPKEDVGKMVEREKYLDIIQNKIPDEISHIKKARAFTQ